MVGLEFYLEKRKTFLSIKHFINGIFLGTTLLAPGLSVATIAMVLGIYEKLIASISDFFSRKWKEALQTLLPLIVGATIALFISSIIFTWASVAYPYQLNFLFLGLIAGSVPILIKNSNAKKVFKAKHLFFLVLMALLVALLSLFEHPYEPATSIQALDTALVLRLFFAGFIGAVAMLLPGLSAALLLLILGAHTLLSYAISTINLTVLGITLVGSLIGLAIGSRIIKYVLEKHTIMTHAVSIGMVIGSTVVVFPGVPEGIVGALTCIAMLGLGIFIAFILDRYKERHVML